MIIVITNPNVLLPFSFYSNDSFPAIKNVIKKLIMNNEDHYEDTAFLYDDKGNVLCMFYKSDDNFMIGIYTDGKLKDSRKV